MSLILRAATASDAGFGRESNEDAAHVGPALIAVADGMGGLPAGEVASELAIKAFAEAESRSAIPDLKQVVDAANRRIHDAVEVDPACDGMGTTLTALLFTGSELTLAHVGDSRAYRLRDGELTQLTKDDTYVQQLVDRGVISAAEARTHPNRSVVTRAVRGRAVTPTFETYDVRPGDRYLLCTDGLSDVVEADAIARTLAGFPDRHRCAEQLIELALRAGGPDNITTVVADLEPDG